MREHLQPNGNLSEIRQKATTNTGEEQNHEFIH